MTSALALLGCASLTKAPLGLTAAGGLQPCPSAPRCVSSFDPRPKQRIAPLVLREARSSAWVSLQQVLDAMPRTTLVDQQANYVRAEIISPWRFYTDDVELLLADDGVTVQVRSSARIGYYDFQVNRERVEALRAAAAEAGILRVGKDG